MIYKLMFPTAPTSPFPWFTSMRCGVDGARQAVAGFGCAAALEVEYWFENI